MPLPDLIEIVPLDKPVRAEITVPGSKSITNRALILAALADGEVTLTGALWSEDTQVMAEALKVLGFEVKVEIDPDEFCNRTISVKGLGGRIPNAGKAEKPLELFVGNAGTAARFLSAMVCLGNGVYRLSGVPRMHERPQAALFRALRELGYRVDSPNDKLPAVIHGESEAERGSVSRSASDNSNATADSNQLPPAEAAAGHRPALRNRACAVSIVESSQFASALLLCATHAKWKVSVLGENTEESPYVAMTLKLVEVFPGRGGRFQIEPDASSGSYFWAAGWMLPHASIPVPSVGMLFSSKKRDEYYREMDGVHESLSSVSVLRWPDTEWQIDRNFTVFHMMPKPHTISRLNHLGDSIMTLITITPLLRKERCFVDLGRLRLQECERVVALRTELTKCGAKVIEEGDTLTVYPSELHGAEIETYNDHRMAMCFAILGLKVPGIKLKNPACVKKTFPNFFQKLAAPPPHGLGAEIRDGRTGRKLGLDELFAE